VLTADNANFGDPCVGTVKNVTVQLAVGTASTPASTNVCATAAENSNATLTAPTGKVFTGVVFASYGTPTGTCGAYAKSYCAADATAFATKLCVGKSTCAVGANNGNFGDPCYGTVKKINVELTVGPAPAPAGYTKVY